MRVIRVTEPGRIKIPPDSGAVIVNPKMYKLFHIAHGYIHSGIVYYENVLERDSCVYDLEGNKIIVYYKFDGRLCKNRGYVSDVIIFPPGIVMGEFSL